MCVCERRLTHTHTHVATPSPSRKAPRVPPVDLAQLHGGLRPHPNANANPYLSPKPYPAEPRVMYYEPPTARTAASGSLSERPTAAALLSERSSLPRARRGGGGRGSGRGSSSARSFKAPTVRIHTHSPPASLPPPPAHSPRVCEGPSVRCSAHPPPPRRPPRVVAFLPVGAVLHVPATPQRRYWSQCPLTASRRVFVWGF